MSIHHHHPETVSPEERLRRLYAAYRSCQNALRQCERPCIGKKSPLP
ncbi:MAG: hypothetical protein RRY53_03460 [Pseudoflavonifractor sp.]